MRQFTTVDQTTKLIELGFEKPKYATMFWRNEKEVTEINYTIGELIELLPQEFRNASDSYLSLSIHTGGLGTWEIQYLGFEARIRTCEFEFIDALKYALEILV